MPEIMSDIQQELAALKSQALHRNLQLPQGQDFCSNDFHGLSRSKFVRETLIHFLQQQGELGATGSRLVSGQSKLVQETEDDLARLFSAPAALFFGSGYLANLGVTYALASPECEFFSDELNHASLIDGMRLCRAQLSIYRHKDLAGLRRLLKNSNAKRKIVVTESVFSMDGDGPDLAQLCTLLNEFAAYLILDEAHATGICGPTACGRAEGVAFDLERSILVHPCGKALGGYGAFVTTSHALRELMINKARSFIFSTALSPLHIVQSKAALTELQAHPEPHARLKHNITLLNQYLRSAQIQATPTSHIVAIPVEGNDRVLKAAEFLQKNNFYVRAIRSPTVPKGQERLRITVKSFHEPALYQEFVACLSEALA